MARIVLRNVRKGKRRTALLDLNSITRQQIEEQLEKNKAVILASFQKIIKEWSSDVDFSARKIITGDYIAINIFPVGSDKKVWDYVDKGTKPHTIKAKKAPLLVFRTGYNPKTLAKPARTVSGGGQSTGDWVTAIEVNHPGIEGRNFTGELAEDFKQPFKDLTEKTFRQVARMVQE